MLAYSQVHMLRAGIASLLPRSSGSLTTALQELDGRAAALEGAARRGRGRGAATTGAELKSFAQLQGDYAGLFGILEEADEPPTTQAVTALQGTLQEDGHTAAIWKQIQVKDLPALNTQLKAAGLDPLTIQ